VRAELSAARQQIDEMRDALTAAQARERWLADELQHRVRNMLGVIRSICRRTWESGASREEFAGHFEGRLNAVARYNSHLRDIRGIDLEDLIRDELLELGWRDGPRCTINGPSVSLRDGHAELMGLVIHELATNAMKFGPLPGNGTLSVSWSLEDAPASRSLRFNWAEAGVSVVRSAPRLAGFGRQLIEEALPYQLGATTSFELKPGGLACSIILPLPKDAVAPDTTHEPQDVDEPSILPSATEQIR
jgi:two-component sensor histidine kinase